MRVAAVIWCPDLGVFDVTTAGVLRTSSRVVEAIT
jgi:hypothetical protein